MKYWYYILIVLGLGICIYFDSVNLHQSTAMLVGLFCSSIGLYGLSKSIPSNSTKTNTFIVTEYDEEE